MSAQYFIRFGSGDPRLTTGITPTFLIFTTSAGAAQVAPAITEAIASSGLYTFTWGTTTPITFLADGFTTSLGSGRYVTGALDPVDRVDQNCATLLAFSSTLRALGNTGTAFGGTGVAIGTLVLAQGSSDIAIGNTILSYVVGFSGQMGGIVAAIGN